MANISTKSNNIFEQISAKLISLDSKKKRERFLCIDLGPNFAKIAYFKLTKARYHLVNYQITELSAVQDKNQEIRDFIKNFTTENRIKEKEVYLTISDYDHLNIKHISLPVVPNKEILQMAKWQLKDEFTFDLDTATIDWQIIDQYTDNENTKKYDLLFTIIEDEVVKKYISILEGILLTPVVVSAPVFSYAAILKTIKSEHKIQTVLDIGYEHTNLCVYKDSKLRFVREIPFSYSKLIQSLTGVLTSEKGKVELDHTQAKEIVETYGFPDASVQALRENLTSMQVIGLMRPNLELLVKEIKRSFDYFVSHFKDQSPSLIDLTGIGSRLKNLDKFLKDQLSLQISTFSFSDNFDLSELNAQEKASDKAQLLSFTPLILEHSQEINLLPHEIRVRKAEFIEKVFLRVTGITVAAIFIFSLFITQFLIHDYKKRIKNSQAKLRMIKDVKVLKHRCDIRDNFINLCHSRKVPVDGLLKVLSQVVPTDIILDELTLNQNKHILTLKGIVLKSGKSAESVVTDFMQKIEESLFFTEATLLASEKIGAAQKFEIECNLAY